MDNNKSPLYNESTYSTKVSHTVDPALFYAAPAITPDEPDNPLLHDPYAPDSRPSPPSPNGHDRQK